MKFFRITRTLFAIIVLTIASIDVTAKDITTISTIDRETEEILELSPYYTGNGAFGGRDAGMSNYSIDGANFNANLGLDREKMPGGGSTPFSFDAIEEIQIVTSAASKPLVVDSKRVDENNQPIYRLNTYKDAEGVTHLVDYTFDVTRNTTNCWRLQIGVKYIFN